MPSSVIRTGPEVAAKLSDTAQMLRARMEGLDRPSVGLALGCGVARGLAHIGVLKALLANAIAIDVMVGCSIGAVVGGCYAAGVEPDQMEDIARSIDKRIVFRHLDFAVPNRGGLIAGARVSDLLKELTMNKTFGQLRIGFACTAADIHTGEEVVLETGVLHEAIRASLSIPGVFQPVVMGSRVLVDGGIVNPIPANYLVAMGVDVVIGVDVTPELIPSERDIGKPPSIVFTLINAFDIMARVVSEPTADIVDVMIRPDVGRVFGGDFWLADELIERGWEATQEQIPRIKEAIREASRRPR